MQKPKDGQRKLIYYRHTSFYCTSQILHFLQIEEHKVIIVGLDNAGKTTILYQFSMNEVVHTSPTIGSNVEEIVINNTRFLMWDIGGQESLRSSWNTYYTNTEFVIVVVDSTDRERISVTREELYKMLAHEFQTQDRWDFIQNDSTSRNYLHK
ncbi:PREDICTED: ADP-ribosylation factor-like protein 5A isoform X3 [Hipposideros armiger]|uniref:ADP-ribosylation factor-like protein 5A isoform X3 n=1 Tax=Hipposideros armiger TaxID=186990 RepID=A0A8B7RSK1_HIPAR|nr:PREDICTED: ADP-ribosylation factor-like protein 5A isoform X3 [Hipposideros armiger]